MLKATVSVGECSIHVMVRGNLMMSIPHRLWESRVDEEGSVLWCGEARGSKALQSLVGYLEEKIRGCENFSELFHTVDEIQKELSSPLWGMSQVEEKRQADLEKKEKEEKERLEREAEANEAKSVRRRARVVVEAANEDVAEARRAA